VAIARPVPDALSPIPIPSEARATAAKPGEAPTAGARPASPTKARVAPDRAAPAAPPKAAESSAQTVEANPGETQTLSAVEAGKAYLRDGGNSELGGVVSYKGHPRPEIDYKLKARQLYQAGKFREAADSYQHATQKAPSDAAAFAGLGASWLSAGEPDRAIVAYQRAVQLKPEVSGFQAALGRAYLTKGDRGRAAAAYSKALALDPNNQAAKTGMAGLRP
jgi:tetratricopeptide (TPR) repeat protein